MSLNEQLPPPSSGQPNYPPAPPAPPAQPAPPRPWSVLAIVGFVLAFVAAPVGFVLSFIAIFKTGRARAKGRGLAIAGLIVSTLLLIVGIGAVVWVSNYRPFDPGCGAGRDAIIAIPSTPDQAAIETAVDALNAAAAKAKHDDVRAAIQAMAADYNKVLAAITTGAVPPDLEQKLTSDAEKFDTVCTIGG